MNVDHAPRRRSVARDRSYATHRGRPSSGNFFPLPPVVSLPRGENVTRLIVACQMALVLVGCAAPSPTVRLRAGYFAAQDFLPYLVIQDQGFDHQNGLQLDTRSYPGGAAALAAMAEGSLDIAGAVGTVPLLAAAERGLIPGAVVAVAANVFTDEQHRAVAVLTARAGRGWRDLSGARIAVNARDSITAAALVGRFRLEGVRDYTFVEIPFANMGLAVAGGNVAAAGMNEPFLTQSLARGDGVLLDWVMGGGTPFARAEVSAVVVGAELLRRDPQAIKAYLRAHLQAVRWINDNTGQARRVLARRLDLTRDVAERFNLLRWPEDARNDPALLEAMQPLLVEVGVLKAVIPARRLYDEALLEQVLAERRQARR